MLPLDEMLEAVGLVVERAWVEAAPLQESNAMVLSTPKQKITQHSTFHLLWHFSKLGDQLRCLLIFELGGSQLEQPHHFGPIVDQDVNFGIKSAHSCLNASLDGVHGGEQGVKVAESTLNSHKSLTKAFDLQLAPSNSRQMLNLSHECKTLSQTLSMAS